MAVSHVVSMGFLDELNHIWLGDNYIRDAGISALANACAGSVLPNLQTLDLHENQIGDAGIKAFAKVVSNKTSLPSLKNLYLDVNLDISDVGLLALADAVSKGALKSLGKLCVDEPGHKVLKKKCETRGITLCNGEEDTEEEDTEEEDK
jgi:Ran GTPase-activating protein (RanGAP) involved in mRNA processing and transport